MKTILLTGMIFIVSFMSSASVNHSKNIQNDGCLSACSTVREIFVDNLYDEMGMQSFDITTSKTV